VDTDDPTNICRPVREVLSCVLDGEAAPGDTERLARVHLAACRDCTRWYDQATRLDRLLRIGPVAADESELADTVLSRVRTAERGRRRAPLRAVRLRAALLPVALIQLVIGVVSLSGPIGMSMGMTMTHMDHEEAAFNIAFGVALLRVAWDWRRAAVQVPMLTTFVLVLGVSSIFDLLDGAVTWTRLVTHLPILAGLLLSAALARAPAGEPGPLTQRLQPPDPQGRRPSDGFSPDRPPRTDHHRPQPAARRDVA
jgi:predicted anti-sigma-YlaC factor YlaD